MFVVAAIALLPAAAAWPVRPHEQRGGPALRAFRRDTGDSASLAASGLLYADMQNARARAALAEGESLAGRITALEVPLETTVEGARAAPPPKRHKVIPARGGTGFKASAKAVAKDKADKKKLKATPYEELSVREKQIQHQVAVLRSDGCLRINGALSESTARRIRACILREIDNAAAAVEADPSRIASIHEKHGIDQQRINRCVINLPLRADVIDGHEEAVCSIDGSFEKGTSQDPIVEAMEELLDPVDGALAPLVAKLCGANAPLYELASLVTYPGSLRQSVHPDAAHQPNAPLYAAFLACQDITEEMGPTLFLPGTHEPNAQRAKYDDMGTREQMIAEFPSPKLATLKAGDLVIFDMRCLHVGSENHLALGSTRVLFNLTFRNPAADKDIGYEGSIRKKYHKKFNLKSLQEELAESKATGKRAFVGVA